MSIPCLCAISSTERPIGASTSRRVPSRSMKVILGIRLASGKNSSPLRPSGAERWGEVGCRRQRASCRGETPHPPHCAHGATGPFPLPTACGEGEERAYWRETASLFRFRRKVFGTHGGAQHG